MAHLLLLAAVLLARAASSCALAGGLDTAEQEDIGGIGLGKTTTTPLPVLQSAPLPSCPRLYVGPDCTSLAVPSCELLPGRFVTCDSHASCACLAECEAGHMLGRDELHSTCYQGGQLASEEEARRRPWQRFNRSVWVEAGVRGSQRWADGGAPSQPPDHVRFAWDDSFSASWRGGGSERGASGREGLLQKWTGAPPLSPVPAQRCPDRCGGRGDCDGGACVCRPPFGGLACALPLARGEGPHADIYLYELPQGFNAWRPRKEGQDRNTALLLYEHLATSTRRTTDPSKAWWFWLPIATLSGATPDGVILLALQYVRQRYPFYNTSGGRDHVVAYGWDSGACWISSHPLVVNTTSISHFGLKARADIMGCNCEVCGHGGSIIVPDVMELKFKRKTHMRYRVPDTRPRPSLVFFSGTRTGALRIRMLDSFNMSGTADPLIRVLTRSDVDLAAEMQNARFCLVPPGAGFTTRGTLAIIHGCVPVIGASAGAISPGGAGPSGWGRNATSKLGRRDTGC